MNGRRTRALLASAAPIRIRGPETPGLERRRRPSADPSDSDVMHTVLDDTPECGYTRFPALIEGAARAPRPAVRIDERNRSSARCRRIHTSAAGYELAAGEADLTDWDGCLAIRAGRFRRASANRALRPRSLDKTTVRPRSRGKPRTSAADKATRPSAGTGDESVREEVRRHGGTEDPHPAEVV